MERKSPNKMVRDIIQLYTKHGFKEPPRPSMMDKDLLKMRLNFILEEFVELVTACGHDLDFRIIDKGTAPNSDINVKEIAISVEDFEEDPAPEKIIDALVDLLVVTIGNCYLFGLLNVHENPVNIFGEQQTILDEAWDRVQRANLQKERGLVSKRGHEMDLVKPEGWKPPDHSDLVDGMGI